MNTQSEIPLETVGTATSGRDFSPQEIVISDAVMSDFCNFLQEKKDFLEDGLGVFHTDNHGNW